MEKKENIRETINKLPKLPGIYKMIDSNGNIIYIGKSKCLKNRVNSYFTKNHTFEKIKKMVSLIDSIEYTVTDTHLEARLLECMLIKDVKPHFNSQMKHDQGYVYLTLEDKNKNQPLSITLDKREGSFGPFRSKTTLMNSIAMLRSLYPIKKSNDVNNPYDFTYHIFPVSLDKDMYHMTKDLLIDLLNNEVHMRLFLEQLEVRMMEASDEFRFETAIFYRELISNITYLLLVLDGYKELYDKKIIAKIPAIDGHKLFLIHKGTILASKKYKRLRDTYIESFTRKYQNANLKYDIPNDEKVAKDFKDIIYSELLSLPKSDLIYLN